MSDTKQIVIPLPEDMTFDEWYTTRGRLVTIGMVTVLTLSIAIWDYFALLKDEIRIYRNGVSAKMWKTPTFWAFVILRYSIFLAFLPPIWLTVIGSQHCDLMAQLSMAGLVLTTASAGLIFFFRVDALFLGALSIRVTVGVLYVFLVGCWIASATQYHAVSGPLGSLLSLSNCQFIPIPSWVAISYASSVVFDISIVALSILRLQDTRSSSAIGRQIYYDNLVYFIIVTSSNIVALAVQSLSKDYQLLKPTVVPFSTLMTAAIGQRVFLNLKLFHSRHSSPYNGSTAGSVERPSRFSQFGPMTPHSLIFAEAPAIPLKAKSDLVDGTSNRVTFSDQV